MQKGPEDRRLSLNLLFLSFSIFVRFEKKGKRYIPDSSDSVWPLTAPFTNPFTTPFITPFIVPFMIHVFSIFTMSTYEAG